MRAVGKFLSVFAAFACWTMGALAEDDAANGKDVYKAFTVRVSLFVAVSLYAWFAARIFERWRSRRIQRKVSIPL